MASSRFEDTRTQGDEDTGRQGGNETRRQDDRVLASGVSSLRCLNPAYESGRMTKRHRRTTLVAQEGNCECLDGFGRF